MTQHAVLYLCNYIKTVFIMHTFCVLWYFTQRMQNNVAGGRLKLHAKMQQLNGHTNHKWHMSNLYWGEIQTKIDKILYTRKNQSSKNWFVSVQLIYTYIFIESASRLIQSISRDDRCRIHLRLEDMKAASQW